VLLGFALLNRSGEVLACQQLGISRLEMAVRGGGRGVDFSFRFYRQRKRSFLRRLAKRNISTR